ncbi:cytochrome c [Desulfuromonas carbonis]|uniref:cytochrome C n=1 Tax=Desulfuromonas sp. DDH964 TaxID=1823759 RepID=UPI00078D222B|nr:cytochrome C [Desulfuromonas sp. DDH964]AMV71909.1 Fructose dehydrogenase cytochrome subunit precursor [Desulfuromonas sp. DDH964]
MFTLRKVLVGILLLAVSPVTSSFAQPAAEADAESLNRGRYLARIAGCNDCHTAGYAQSGGNIPEAQWLMGDQLGWRGPWGTTYSSNLRLYMQNFSEDQWVQIARTAQFRPPMPWFALRDMTEGDLRAIYRFVRQLGDAGAPAPSFVPPGQEPKGPFVLFPAPPSAK